MNTKGKIRKQYKKPQVSQVKLEIEEAVLAGCKVASLNNGKTGNISSCITAPCKTTPGS